MSNYTESSCEAVRITVLDENFVDILLPSTPRLRRFNMDQSFNPKYGDILAENGFCVLIESYAHGTVSTVLYDGGLTANVVLHNAALLGVDLRKVDAVVLSHGHPDHFGGLAGVIEAIGHPVPVVVHPDAFRPRMIVKKHMTLPMINIGLTRSAIEAAGGHLMEVRGSIPLAPGVFTSGPLTTTTDFELESPAGRLCVHEDGAVEVDEIDDHQTLGILVDGVGLVSIDPCGHSGVVSSVERLRALSGTPPVHAVLGGFHTGHPAVTDERIRRTAEALAEMAPTIVAPMHCSGFRMKRAVSEVMPDAFEQLTVGSILTIGEFPSTIPTF